MDLTSSAPQGTWLHRAEGDKGGGQRLGRAEAKDECGEPSGRRDQEARAESGEAALPGVGGRVVGLSWMRRPQG